MEPVTLEELKAFARVDLDHDDVLITSLGIAAREFVEQAAGIDVSSAEAPPVPERAKLAIMSLTAHWYEARLPVESVTTMTEPLPFHVRALIHQLTDWTKLCPVEETTA